MEDGRNNELIIWRCIAIFGAILLLSRIIPNIINNDYHTGTISDSKDSFSRISMFVINVIGFFVFIFLIFQPLKLELYGIFSFLYAVYFFIDGYSPLMGVLMFILSFSTLYKRGFYRKNKKTKFIFTCIFLSLIMISGIRYGIDIWFDGFINTFGYLFIIGLIAYVILSKVAKDKKYSGQPVLDFNKFPDLTERDKEWIKLLITETKYTTIAHEYGISFGTVRNRMRYIFKILGVPDRIGFMASFSGYEILG
ncbi:helix-turn-helix transcriptional regulator [Treponema brennaborense]|uniref:Regulatory protein LuxR n=1 Tax=Treponema brennaborense (strain DSM 12168 / CIP 105900 / DD5/3) TaxID=906968 RepID=F4LNF5_TREBD|nr:LuxR family transcriptional regulator [Treponema brennaborense]AEE17913.1 regulatory protein LuxR [Treponema brennaborense DSM 12168]